MKNEFKRMLSVLFVVAQLMTSKAMAADTSIASLDLSGDVPAIFSVTMRGLPGDLDLTPGVIVNNRLLGLVHFKYNEDIATLKVASSTASGVPESASGAYAFGTAFKVAFTAAGCTTVAAAFNAAFALVPAGTDVKSLASTTLTNGVEEDCQLTASWGGTAASLPLAGVYSMNITVTMVSI